MYIETKGDTYYLIKEGQAIGWCQASRQGQAVELEQLFIQPAWRRKGYGTYLCKEVLRSHGGFAPHTASVFYAPLCAGPAAQRLAAKFGFSVQQGRLCRRHTPDLSAVQLAQQLLALYMPQPHFCIDATCGNGGDTAFLCRLAGPQGHVLAMDIQPKAIEATRARLQAEGLAGRCTLVCADHAALAQYAAPGSADVVMFNFGWLPGADHSAFSTAQSSIPALQAALAALRPGGVLSAVLYSGKVIGSAEKQAVHAWLAALPLTQYTVLACEFANWAQTAPLPCLVLKKP